MNCDFFLNLFGLFFILAGFVIGLGSVTVIDLHGFLGRKSSYWTEATIRTHKVTKILIWIGIFLLVFGTLLFFRDLDLKGFLLHHILVLSFLVLNGLFLSFYISPILLNREKEGKEKEILPKNLQNKIFFSFIFSVMGWWFLLFYFVFNLLKYYLI